MAACLIALVGCDTAMPSFCADPVPGDSAWYRKTWTPEPDGSMAATTPEPPRQPAPGPADWTGTFRLWLVPTVGGHEGEVTRAVVTLHGSDEPGTAYARDGWPSRLSLYPRSPTVEADLLYDAPSGNLTVVLGDPDLAVTDAGVFLDVFTADGRGATGRWVDGGIVLDEGDNAAQGWFCLARRR